MRRRVAVLDYGSGNVRSVVRAVERVGVDVELTADRGKVADADGLVVPGVGAFASCMAGLKAVRGDQLIRQRLSQDQAVLGICVGMQILFSAGFEHGQQTAGVGLWSGAVERLHGPIVPHMGWNTVRAPTDSAMFDGVSSERFYFVHSYGVHAIGEWGPRQQVTWTDHGDDSFVAAVEQGPLWATQFHPEKSADAGRRLLQNWVGQL